MEEKDRLMQSMWAEKQALQRAIAQLPARDSEQVEEDLKERIENIRKELSRDKQELQEQLEHTRDQLKQAEAARIEDQEEMTRMAGEKEELQRRLRELESRYAQADETPQLSEDSKVREVIANVGSGITEHTARRLLLHCHNDAERATRLARAAFDAVQRRMEEMETSHQQRSEESRRLSDISHIQRHSEMDAQQTMSVDMSTASLWTNGEVSDLFFPSSSPFSPRVPSFASTPLLLFLSPPALSFKIHLLITISPRRGAELPSSFPPTAFCQLLATTSTNSPLASAQSTCRFLPETSQRPLPTRLFPR
eukprot:748555-Hanusia_phi.AAC.2